MSLRCSILLMFLIAAVAGCRPGAGGNEQKEPYFLAGKNRLQERDYQGAIEMFEKALDVNPRSASAHFELGILYEQQQGDYAAALYHYQKAINLRGDMLSADLARQRIQECKRELAKSVTTPVTMDKLVREVDSLRAENQLLKQQLQAWQSFYAGRPAPPTNPPAPPPAAQPPTNPPPQNPQLAGGPRIATPAPAGQPARTTLQPASNRLHTVNSGETLGTIARRYNVRLAALQSANPTIDARRLRPGQALVIPPP